MMMRNYKYAFELSLAVCLVCLLTGCGMYKEYSRPAGMVADSLYGAAWTTSDTASIASLSWKELFTDPYLDTLIEEALRTNIDLKVAALNVAQAESALKSAKLNWLPTLSFAPAGGVSYFNNWAGMETGASWTWSVPVAASWEIDIMGKKMNERRRARAQESMARDYEQAVRTGLVAGVAMQYYTLLMLDEQLGYAQSTAEKMRRSVSVLTVMKKAGMVNEIAVDQMSGSMHNIEAGIEDMKRSITQIETSLCLTLAQTPHSIARGDFSGIEFPQSLNVGIPLDMVSRRPDVRAAEGELKSAYYSANIARASMYPSLTLGGTAGWTNTLGSAIVNPAGLLAAATASLFQPIFNGRALRSNAEIASARQKQAELKFNQSILNAGAEVNDALTRYQTALAKEKLREAQVSALSSAVRRTERLMSYSSITYLEVLAAQESQLSAQTQQSQDIFEKISAVISLYHALGGF